jgi:hypothetical protein
VPRALPARATGWVGGRGSATSLQAEGQAALSVHGGCRRSSEQTLRALRAATATGSGTMPRPRPLVSLTWYVRACGEGPTGWPAIPRVETCLKWSQWSQGRAHATGGSSGQRQELADQERSLGEVALSSLAGSRGAGTEAGEPDGGQERRSGAARAAGQLACCVALCVQLCPLVFGLCSVV